jgi:glycosyltransferase involved in cell wall biosynthesis
MDEGKKIYIIIPAFNEEKKIGSVIKSLKDNGYHNILVVNDGSTDNTEKIAAESEAEILNHIINRGQGAALRTGIEYLREAYNPDAIVTFDADGQHSADDIENLIYPVINDGFDITLGSRFLKEGNKIPSLRKIILKAAIIFTRIISNIKLTDTHNGLRALGKKAIEKIKISQRGMEHASEIIDEIIKNKLKYKEVPVKIIYSDYSKAKGQKSSNLFRIGAKVLVKKITK